MRLGGQPQLIVDVRVQPIDGALLLAGEAIAGLPVVGELGVLLDLASRIDAAGELLDDGQLGGDQRGGGGSGASGGLLLVVLLLLLFLFVGIAGGADGSGRVVRLVAAVRFVGLGAVDGGRDGGNCSSIGGGGGIGRSGRI